MQKLYYYLCCPRNSSQRSVNSVRYAPHQPLSEGLGSGLSDTVRQSALRPRSCSSGDSVDSFRVVVDAVRAKRSLFLRWFRRGGRSRERGRKYDAACQLAVHSLSFPHNTGLQLSLNATSRVKQYAIGDIDKYRRKVPLLDYYYIVNIIIILFLLLHKISIR